jgi:photosystem II stability/assembly factor-like uncharacterized protein
MGTANMIDTILSLAMEDSLLTIHGDGDRRTESSSAMSCRCVASDPGMRGRAYCGTNEVLLRTDNGAASWHVAHHVPPGRRVTAVAVSPTERGRDGSGVVYVGTEPSAVFRSTDAGVRWDELRALVELPSASTWSFPPRPDTHHVRWIALDPIRPARLFVAIEAGALVHSDDGGRTWQDRAPTGPLDTHTLVIHAHEPTRMYAAAGDGYFESHDAGATWEKLENGLRNRYVWGCVVDPDDPDTVIISAAQSPMAAHSSDRAESWIYRKSGRDAWRPITAGLPEPAGTTVSTLAIDPGDSTVVYAANNRGIFRSDDMGETWRQLEVTWPRGLLKQRVQGLAVCHTNATAPVETLQPARTNKAD